MVPPLRTRARSHSHPISSIPGAGFLFISEAGGRVMGSGARRIHTEFEQEVVARLERIEKRLEHAGFHIPCLSDRPPEGWTDDRPPTVSGTHELQPQKWIGLAYHKPKEGDERTVDLDENVLSYRRPRPVPEPDDLESYGYIDDRGEVGMQDFDGGDSA